MTLYGRMLRGESPSAWKWCFCTSCRCEWLVPAGNPDAYPKFCCHCRNKIDLTLRPEDVIDEAKARIRDRHVAYDINVDASQVSRFELSPEASVRVQAFEELVDVDDVEYLLVGQEVTMLVNETVAFSFRLSHYSLVFLAAFLEDYTSRCEDLICKQASLVDAEELARFKAFTPIEDDLEELDEDSTTYGCDDTACDGIDDGDTTA